MATPPLPTIKGSVLINWTDQKLAGLRNAFTQDQKLAFLNEGKDEIWGILKTLNQNYFVTPSQATDNTLVTYFAPLSTSSREYTLPADCRDILFIEVTAPVGFEFVRFVKKGINTNEFREERRASTANQNQSLTSLSVNSYYYDVVGKLTFMLAQLPEQAFTLIIWYVRALPEIQINQVFDEILFPYSKKLVDYAVARCMLIKDPAAWTAWVAVWKNDVILLTETAGRDDADIRTVEDFMGD